MNYISTDCVIGPQNKFNGNVIKITIALSFVSQSDLIIKYIKPNLVYYWD